MFFRTVARLAGVLVLGTAFASRVAAQDLPPIPPGMTPEQAREILATRPDLVIRLQEWIRNSGMTPEQIRARLRAAGYPGNFLDAYFEAPDGAGADPAAQFPPPSLRAVSALRATGFGETVHGDSLLLAGDTTAFLLYRDSLRLDSILKADALMALRRRAGLLPLFGLETLRQPTTQFQPVVSGPVDDNYVLGPGDELVLLLTGAVELVRTFEISRDGLMVLPQVGRLSANGLTLEQFRRVLGQRLAQVYSGASTDPGARTRFELMVSRVRMQLVRVVGEVSRPGAYLVAATGGVLTALYEAGGLTENANFRQIDVRRGEQLVGTVDLYTFLARGVVPTHIALAPGDVVHVPLTGPRVALAGEVRRPARYEVRQGESLREIIQLAGGVTAMAATGRATISRVVPPAERTEAGPVRRVVTVDLAAALGATAAPVPLHDGDSVTVFRAPAGARRSVTVLGSVWQPGTYELTAGMRIWDAIQAAGGVRPETYRGRVQVVRTMPDSTRRMFGVALGPDDAPPPPAENPVLASLDSITVFARTAFRPERFVSISGAVRHQDTVAFADSMTLRDAILLAGGVTDGASLTEAVVTRLRLAGSAGERIGETIRVPLDSSYVFDATAYVTRPVGAGGPAFYLQPFDHVTVLTHPGWRAPQRVILTGEVANPGTYLLVEEGERLSGLIARAGGLTERAHQGGIAFYRAAFTGVGRQRVGIDVARALRDPGERADVPLLDGDSIHVPITDLTVRVEGAVNAPTAVAYMPGALIGRYVAAAGGWTQDAHRDETFVLQANGIIERGGRPGPGSTVVVPVKNLELDRPSQAPAIFAAIAQVAAAITTIVIVLVR